MEFRLHGPLLIPLLVDSGLDRLDLVPDGFEFLAPGRYIFVYPLSLALQVR